MAALEIALVQAGPSWLPELTAGAWMCALTGVFLLAVAFLARDPFDGLGANLGGERSALRAAKGAIFKRAQLALGFLFLLCALGMGLAAHLNAAPEHGRSATFWIGAVLVTALVGELALWWWAKQLLKRHVERWTERAGGRLDTDAALAREIGDLFGVEQREDDTVEAYVARVRKAAGLPSVERISQSKISMKAALATESEFEED